MQDWRKLQLSWRKPNTSKEQSASFFCFNRFIHYRLSMARKDREVMIEQRKVEYKNALILQDWLKERERMKIELGIELRGDLTVEEERFLRSQIDEKMEKTKSLQK